VVVNSIEWFHLPMALFNSISKKQPVPPNAEQKLMPSSKKKREERRREAEHE